VAEIDYIAAVDDYVSVHTRGRSYLKHQTMASLERAMDPAQFVRIHRSTIVRLDRIKRVELHTKDRYIAILHDGATLSISRSGHKRLKAVLG
jgi:two-component system LytT family response regulator